MIKKIEADSVLTKIDFQEDTDFETYPLSIYKCPICKQEMSLNMNDFKKHYKKSLSNLQIDHNRKIDDFYSMNGYKSNSFLDFYCPKCNTATCIYYTFWGGGRYTAGYHLDCVIVLTN